MERAEVPGMIREQRLSRWIEEYSDSILHTCFLYLSDQGQAEDATQDISGMKTAWMMIVKNPAFSP